MGVSFCVTVDNFGRALTYNGKTWSDPTTMEPGDHDLAAVSCPTTTFCMAVDQDGDAVLGT